MRKLTLTAFALLLAGLHSCQSTSRVGYSDGWVKSSTVTYSFDGPPALDQVRGGTYHFTVENEAGESTAAIPTFEEKGMNAASTDGADVHVEVALGSVTKGEPGAMKLGDKWYPGFEVSVPYEVKMQEADGSELTSSTGRYSNHLTFRQFPGFATRDEAVGVLGTVQRLAGDGIDEQAQSGAAEDAVNYTNQLAASLFEEQSFSLDVPVVRAAAGLDMEEAFTLLAEAKNPAEVREALRAYQRIGMNQFKDDGTPNNTANYGVACGIAACKLMLRDLGGAWEASALAHGFEPGGDEVTQIRRVIYRQELETGIRVIPERERELIDSRMKAASSLEQLFSGRGE